MNGNQYILIGNNKQDVKAHSKDSKYRGTNQDLLESGIVKEKRLS
jgi:hypothetical protein